MFDAILCEKIMQLANFLISKQLKLGTAESCTGGGLSYALSSIRGSSQWFERGLVTYSNDAKMTLLGVKATTLQQYGAVSQETAEEMVNGLLLHHPLDLGIAITGIAGPDGGSLEKPIGTVWIAWKAKSTDTTCMHFHFNGDRNRIRVSSIEAAIDQLLILCDKIA